MRHPWFATGRFFTGCACVLLIVTACANAAEKRIVVAADGSVDYRTVQDPWRPHGAVTFIDTAMEGHIRPQGWHNWNKPEQERTARYAEYNSSGPGAQPDQRVSWSKQLSKAEAERITVSAVLCGSDGWDPLAGLPK